MYSNVLQTLCAVLGKCLAAQDTQDAEDLGRVFKLPKTPLACLATQGLYNSHCPGGWADGILIATLRHHSRPSACGAGRGLPWFKSGWLAALDTQRHTSIYSSIRLPFYLPASLVDKRIVLYLSLHHSPPSEVHRVASRHQSSGFIAATSFSHACPA
jgi:hypothetical protein